MKHNFIKSVLALALGLISMTAMAKQYCGETITSNDGTANISLTCKTVSPGNYQIIVEGENLNGFGGSFFNPGTVDLRTTITTNTSTQIVCDIAAASAPNLYTPLYVMMPGEKVFTWPNDIEWTATCPSTNNYTITAYVPDGNAAPYIYFWGEGGFSTQGNWPQMTGTAYANTYTYTVENAPATGIQVLFSHSNKQTADQALITEDAFYNVYWNGDNYTADVTTAHEMKDVTITVLSTTATPKIHYWGVADAPEWESDPDMTAVAHVEAGWYEYTIHNVDVNNGVNYIIRIDEAQTADLYTNDNVVATSAVNGTTVTLTDASYPEAQGQEYTVNGYTILVQPIHYTGTNYYDIIINSESSMNGLGGSYCNVNGVGGYYLNGDHCEVSDDQHTITIHISSSSAPNLYTPLYVLMPGEVNFGQIEFDWIEREYESPIEEGDGSVWYYMATGNNGSALYSFTWNQDRTVTIAFVEGIEIKNANHQVNDGDYHQLSTPYTTEATYMRGDNLIGFFYPAYEGGADHVDFTYTVGAANEYYTRATTADDFGTICLPKGGEIAGATLFDIDYKTATSVAISEHAGTMEAGVAYIFQAYAAALYVIEAGEAEDTPVANNALVGTFEAIASVPQHMYIISNNQLHEIDGGTGTLAPYRAYLDMSKVSNQPSGAPVRMIEVANPVATGIENAAAVKATKALVDGKIVIVRNGAIFNLNGMLVK